MEIESPRKLVLYFDIFKTITIKDFIDGKT